MGIILLQIRYKLHVLVVPIQIIVVEWNLTTVWRQEPWLVSPPCTHGLCGPRVLGRVATTAGAEPWSIPILLIIVTLQCKEDNLLS